MPRVWRPLASVFLVLASPAFAEKSHNGTAGSASSEGPKVRSAPEAMTAFADALVDGLGCSDSSTRLAAAGEAVAGFGPQQWAGVDVRAEIYLRLAEKGLDPDSGQGKALERELAEFAEFYTHKIVLQLDVRDRSLYAAAAGAVGRGDFDAAARVSSGRSGGGLPCAPSAPKAPGACLSSGKRSAYADVARSLRERMNARLKAARSKAIAWNKSAFACATPPPQTPAPETPAAQVSVSAPPPPAAVAIPAAVVSSVRPAPHRAPASPSVEQIHERLRRSADFLKEPAGDGERQLIAGLISNPSPRKILKRCLKEGDRRTTEPELDEIGSLPLGKGYSKSDAFHAVLVNSCPDDPMPTAYFREVEEGPHPQLELLREIYGRDSPHPTVGEYLQEEVAAWLALSRTNEQPACKNIWPDLWGVVKRHLGAEARIEGARAMLKPKAFSLENFLVHWKAGMGRSLNERQSVVFYRAAILRQLSFGDVGGLDEGVWRQRCEAAVRADKDFVQAGEGVVLQKIEECIAVERGKRENTRYRTGYDSNQQYTEFFEVFARLRSGKAGGRDFAEKFLKAKTLPQGAKPDDVQACLAVLESQSK
jgi:hypothetical protein